MAPRTSEDQADRASSPDFMVSRGSADDRCWAENVYLAQAPRTPFGEREASLLVAAQVGDLTAWNELVTLYLPEMRRLCFSILRHHEDAEDACIETFVKAQLALPRYKWTVRFGSRSGSFGGWLATIARNTCSDELRKQRRRNRTIRLMGGAQETLALLDFISRDAAVDLFRKEEQLRLEGGLIELLVVSHPRERRVVWLLIAKDLPVEYVAKRCGVSQKTVRLRLRKAVDRLRGHPVVRLMAGQTR